MTAISSPPGFSPFSSCFEMDPRFNFNSPHLELKPRGKKRLIAKEGGSR